MNLIISNVNAMTKKNIQFRFHLGYIKIVVTAVAI